MLQHVISRFLSIVRSRKDMERIEYRLCGEQPRKFSEGSFFQLFPDEFLRVNFADLYDENGCPVSSQWFNKLNGQ